MTEPNMIPDKDLEEAKEKFREAVRRGGHPQLLAPRREQWRLVVAQSASEARSGTAYIMSVTALIVWSVQYFGFHGDLPGAVSAALYVIVPTTITWLATHVAFRKVTL